jgi:nucleoid DNA-binding protein
MADSIENLPARVRTHLEQITRSSGLPDNAESLAKMAVLWAEKKRLFEEQIRSLDMEEVETLAADDPRPVLLLTYSGSLISLGPASARGGRRLEYASIELRADVPHLLVEEAVGPAADLRIEQAAEFSGGRVKRSSSLQKIAVCPPRVGLEEQEKRIREATIYLTNGFVKINRTVLPPAAGAPDQFTLKATVAYLARKNNLTQRQVRQLVDDYLAVVESGMLLGERVPLGRIGRLFLKIRGPRKARVLTNPVTGRELTVPARPEMAVPRISFSRALKEKAARVDLD